MKGEPVMEIKLCVYQGGKLALQIDDGEKAEVPDIDTALAAIRRLVGAEAGEKAMAESAEPMADEAEEKAMTSGYGGGY